MNHPWFETVNLTNVTVTAGTSLMIEKDTGVNFIDSTITGTAENVVIIRTTGAGIGHLSLNNTSATKLNLKVSNSFNTHGSTKITHSDLRFTKEYGNSLYGVIDTSYISMAEGSNNFGEINNSYITGSSYWSNSEQGLINNSYMYGISSSFYLSNYGNITSSYMLSKVHQQSGSYISGSIIDKLVGTSAQIIDSDIKFYESNVYVNMFFDNTFIEDPTATAFYAGYGTPVDQLGDGVPATVFNLNGYNVTVDGINNPRSTKNFPNGVDDLWSPEGVGALWDKEAANLTAFPEPAG